MAIVRPFKALRPKKDIAEKLASHPYDVMNRKEAKDLAKANPYSFLRVVRSEIELDDSVDAYDEKVYLKARENLDKFQKEGILVQDDEPSYYIYRQIMLGRVQTGIVACCSVDEYMDSTIKKHEFTRKDKELDRINHFDYSDANTAPIFLSYRGNKAIKDEIFEWIKFNKPELDFKTEDNITHIVWKISDKEVVERLENEFKNVENLYIADGHHRSASAAKVALKRREENPNYSEEDEFNYFMAVLFPDDDLFIMSYNRIVKDVKLSKDELLKKISEKFEIEEINQEEYTPKKPKTFGMYIDKKWYKLSVKDGVYDKNDPVESIDTAILQKNILDEILGIKDPRTDERINFIGGIRPISYLVEKVDNGYDIGFSMYPTTMEELLKVADQGEVMPPKSTWFEPKLRSGLFVHKLK